MELLPTIQTFLFSTLLLSVLKTEYTYCRYSAVLDAQLIAEYRRVFVRPTNHAKVARKLVHESDWSSVGTISTDKEVYNYPIVNVISVADSPREGKSTGNVYFLLTDLDFTGHDWKKDNKVSFLFSKEQGGECSRNSVDPMEPTCPRAILSGEVIQMDPKNVEYQTAMDAYISRHPSGKKWIIVHSFYLCKLNIKHIFVLDWYGGPKQVSTEDYFNAVPDKFYS